MGLPAALREWLDLSGKIIATLLAPVSAFYETCEQAAPRGPRTSSGGAQWRLRRWWHRYTRARSSLRSSSARSG